jgi:hypothetical protein
VIGPERSGTTWTASALAAGTGSRYVHEPDSPGVNPLATHEATLTRYPVLVPGDHDPSLSSYEALWQLAFSGGWPLRPVRPSVVEGFERLPTKFRAPVIQVARTLLQGVRRIKMHVVLATRRTPASGKSDRYHEPLVVKTVYALFALEWLVDRFPVDTVVVVRRDPLAVASSMIRLATVTDRFDRLRRAYEHPEIRRRFVEPLRLPALPEHMSFVDACAWWACFADIVLDETARGHPWTVVHHEDLLKEPRRALEQLVRQVGGTEVTSLERFVVETGREGAGYSIRRRSGDPLDRWRAGLTAQDQGRLLEVVRRFQALR